MSRSDDDRLADMREAASCIVEVIGRGRSAFDDDIAVRPAVERWLGIVGEAAKSMSAGGRARHPAVSWDDLSRLRDLLAHHYHRIDPEQLWTMASVEIPRLLQQISDER